MTVSQTTQLTAALAAGGLTGLTFAGRFLSRRADPYRVAATGLLTGLMAFAAVIFSAALVYPPMFVAGVFLIGLSSGLFLVGTLSDAMGRAVDGMSGLALGTWGSVQAVAAGAAIACGGVVRDTVGHLSGSPVCGYNAVYMLEILLLFVTLAALGPLVRANRNPAFPLFPIKA